MVAGVQDADGKFTGIQRTFLRPNGASKIDEKPQKMSLGCTGRGAVRLGQADCRLAIAEGVETALSVMQPTGMPSWATLGTGGLLALHLPAETREVIIAADGETAGEDAAKTAAQHLLREGRRVWIARPRKGTDFNDLLLQPNVAGA
jgi:phage/plasmid primase-like uncharacterized protein